MDIDFDTLRAHFCEADRTITLEQFRALSLDELNALISDAHLTRPYAGQARLFHPSSQAAADQKVNFAAPLIKVTNWSTCTHHFIEYQSTLDEFARKVFLAFEDECTEVEVSLFAVSGDTPVLERTRITSRLYSQEFLAPQDKKITVYFHNSAKSPQGLPHVTKKLIVTRSEGDSASSSSRNSDMARYTKNRDNHICQFCGKTDDDANFDAAHLLEKNEIKELTAIEELALYRRLQIDGIDVGRNLITLCTRKCHSKFDCDDIGFTPEKKWTVRPSIANKLIRTNDSVKYGDFDGKDINFRDDVPMPLILHRVWRYTKKTETLKSRSAMKRKRQNANRKKRAQSVVKDLDEDFAFTGPDLTVTSSSNDVVADTATAMSSLAITEVGAPSAFDSGRNERHKKSAGQSNQSHRNLRSSKRSNADENGLDTLNLK